MSAPSTRFKRLAAFFGAGCPSKVRRQESPAPAAVPTTTAKEHKGQRQETIQPAKLKQAVDTIVHIDSLACLHKTLNHTLHLSGLPPMCRLPHCIVNWQNITTDQWVLQVVNGYKLELVSAPIQTSQLVAMATRNDQDLVGQEVQKLLDKGAIKIVDPCPNQYLSRIFLVPKRDGSFRPVVNLKPLNQFIATVHFKMKSLAMMKDLLREGDWMASNIPEGCLPVGRNLGGAPEVPEVYMEAHSVRVSVSSIQSKQCTQDLHQIVEQGSSPRICTQDLHQIAGMTPSSRCSADHVFR